MKTIVFLQSVSTPTATYRVGQAVSLADATADAFIEGGFAQIPTSPLLPTGGATEAKQDAETTATNRAGTREYNISAVSRQSVGAASARVALPTLGASRELYVMATQHCFFRTGDGTVAAAAGTAHPLAADERFHLRIPAGHTHIAYIRDTAEGMISIVPVA